MVSVRGIVGKFSLVKIDCTVDCNLKGSGVLWKIESVLVDFQRIELFEDRLREHFKNVPGK